MEHPLSGRLPTIVVSRRGQPGREGKRPQFARELQERECDAVLSVKFLYVVHDTTLTARGKSIIEHTPAGRFGDPEDLVGAAIWLVSDASRLEDYLERFHLTLAVMQDAEAIERIAYELAEDHAQENVRYIEARFAPVLNTDGGLPANEVLEMR